MMEESTSETQVKGRKERGFGKYSWTCTAKVLTFTGSYQERALPSAGMVPFLQSAACTLDNHCYRPDEVAERSSAQERYKYLLKMFRHLLLKIRNCRYH